MKRRWHDCNCEDFPCCGHYDIGETEPEYCEDCGGYGHSTFDCRAWDDDEDDGEEDPFPDDEGGEDRHLDMMMEDSISGTEY